MQFNKVELVACLLSTRVAQEGTDLSSASQLKDPHVLKNVRLYPVTRSVRASFGRSSVVQDRPKREARYAVTEVE